MNYKRILLEVEDSVNFQIAEAERMLEDVAKSRESKAILWDRLDTLKDIRRTIKEGKEVWNGQKSTG